MWDGNDDDLKGRGVLDEAKAGGYETYGSGPESLVLNKELFLVSRTIKINSRNWWLNLKIEDAPNEVEAVLFGYIFRCRIGGKESLP